MAGIEVTNIPDFSKFEQRARESVENALKKQVAIEVGQMRERISSGRSVTGKSFGSYSGDRNSGYMQKRVDAGRQVSHIDLTFSGQLLQSILSRVERVGRAIVATVYINPARTNVGKSKSKSDNVEIAKALQERFKFFGFTAEQYGRIRDAINNAIKQVRL